MTVTNHVAEIAVPGQFQITIRAAHGELELGQEYDGEWHGIYVQPDNVLTLIRSMLRKIGMDDVHLYEERSGGLCHDIEWPEGPLSRREVAALKAPPDIDRRAVIEDTKQVVGPKDKTAAERQRRCRENKTRCDRDSVTEPVTDHASDRDAPLLELVG